MVATSCSQTSTTTTPIDTAQHGDLQPSPSVMSRSQSEETTIQTEETLQDQKPGEQQTVGGSTKTTQSSSQTSDSSGQEESAQLRSRTESAFGPCTISNLPEDLKPHDHYSKGCVVNNVWIVGSDKVKNEALLAAADYLKAIFEQENELTEGMSEIGVHLAILSENETITSISDYEYLATHHGDLRNWEEVRGLGPTRNQKSVVIGEELLLCTSGRKSDIPLHEISHFIHYALRAHQPKKAQQIEESYNQAMEDEKWVNTYASYNEREYFAEGVTIYFDRSRTAKPADGVKGRVGSREQLAEYDPALFQLIDEVMSGIQLPNKCTL